VSPAVVALLVAAIAALGGVGAAWINSRTSTKANVQSAIAKTLDEVWNQRVLLRDEQIEDLRAELADQAAAHTKQIAEQGAKHTLQIADLTAEVQRLTAKIVELGGVPNES
jgi:hypothetical protein